MPIRDAWNWFWSRFYRRMGDGHRHFGNLYGSQEEHWAAIKSYTRAIELDPTYAQVLFSRGVLYWREIGNYYRAVEDMGRVLELDPGWADAYFNRAVAHGLRNEPNRAIADFEIYLEEGKDEFWLDSARRQLVELQSGQREPSPVDSG